MALSAIKALNHLSNYHLGNMLFRLGLWRSAATPLRKVASRIRSDAGSLFSAQLFARLAICHLKLGSNEEAVEACNGFRRVLDWASVPHEEDRKWLTVYLEGLEQAVRPGERNSSHVTQLHWEAVSDRVKRLFPIEHMSEHFGIPIK